MLAGHGNYNYKQDVVLLFRNKNTQRTNNKTDRTVEEVNEHKECDVRGCLPYFWTTAAVAANADVWVTARRKQSSAVSKAPQEMLTRRFTGLWFLRLALQFKVLHVVPSSDCCRPPLRIPKHLADGRGCCKGEGMHSISHLRWFV